MNAAHTTAGLPPPPDPFQDRYGRPLPPATVALLLWLHVVLVYARQLRITLQHLAGRALTLIGQCFGSAQASFVLSNLSRGILRAIALEHVLLASVEGTPDPAARNPRKRTPRPVQPVVTRQPSAPDGAGSPHPALPTLGQLAAAIRRRPVEGVIDDIRHDLGISFSLCEARFGNALRDMIATYRDTVAKFCNQHLRREAVTADAPEQDSAFDYPPQKPDAIRYIAGFLRAEPICGFLFTAASVATLTAGVKPP